MSRDAFLIFFMYLANNDRKSYDWSPNKLLSLPGFRLQEDSTPVDDPICKLKTGGLVVGGVEIVGPTNTCKRNPPYLTYPSKSRPMTGRDLLLGNYRNGSAIKCIDNTDKANNPHIVYRFQDRTCLLYTSPSPRDRTRSRMPSSA